MEGNKWNERFMKIGEEKVTQLVNQILSRSYGGRCSVERTVEEVIASLNLPSREEMAQLNAELQELNGKLEGVLSRLDELQKRAAVKKGAARKPATQEDLPTKPDGE
jgi:polyhydroxyalkanoate synthesis regulator phasin